MESSQTLRERIISAFSEDPVERSRKAEERFTEAYKRSQEKKTVWSQPVLQKDNWKAERNLQHFYEVKAAGGHEGKETRYLATPNSRANSYYSILDIYNNLQKA